MMSFPSLRLRFAAVERVVAFGAVSFWGSSQSLYCKFKHNRQTLWLDEGWMDVIIIAATTTTTLTYLGSSASHE